ncbi:hypothetical protein BVI434_1890002 [Burkholderia vietnamiensis]|nr:hypothetical protein BVI434_1890002 [Burkholderia vietnamiensis]
MTIGSQIPSKRVCMQSLMVRTEWRGTVPPAGAGARHAGKEKATTRGHPVRHSPDGTRRPRQSRSRFFSFSPAARTPAAVAARIDSERGAADMDGPGKGLSGDLNTAAGARASRRAALAEFQICFPRQIGRRAAPGR